MKGIEFKEGEWGTKAVIRSEWQDSFVNILLGKRTMELELNDGKGWFGTNIDFLRYLPQLKSLDILRLPLDSIEPIHYLNELVELGLTTYSDTPVNFGSFPKLEHCGFEWIKGSDSLFDCKSLKTLGLNNYKKKNSEPFSKLVNLKKLTLLNSGIESLAGIAKLSGLTYLSIANLGNLASLDGIQNLGSLEVLEIQRCKNINRISEIFELNKLERLLILDSGDIDSIHGIENLVNLEEFIFYESTNIIDGDISPVLELKKLKSISFQNRRHYTHKREDFGKLYYGT